jgi:hypothetical protein
MKIYHLHIKDADAAEYDTHFHFTHDTKNGSDLWEDYNNSYSEIIDSKKDDWTLTDILNALISKGWTEVGVERVEVAY